MAHTAANVHAFGGSNYGVWVAPLGTAVPTNSHSTLNAAFNEFGILSAAGLGIGRNINESKTYDMAGALTLIARSQEERPLTFEALEWGNPVVTDHLFPNSFRSVVAGVDEVVTLTITGTPTGGTFQIVYNGVLSSSIAYNAASSVVQTAVRGLSADLRSATVTGSAGSPYTITIPQTDAATFTTVNAFTGGASPNITVAVPTPGSFPAGTRAVGSATVRRLETFGLQAADGSYQPRIVVNNGEAVPSGTVTMSSGGVSVIQFTLNPYADSNGNFYTLLD
jgi:hypothetical protein